ncbi:hypothetical protein SAMN05444274_101594 [Mariniphaga anaerophila]|uniref:Uncharacterized protein n=1 Tax=Mariniphaga anaerophila TaxID=1484053 RepID=A0A1M4U7D0_9BACT|nr:hypothetical protein SAMN05444274_101594 [Mariniphaga anaerophila]
MPMNCLIFQGVIHYIYTIKIEIYLTPNKKSVKLASLSKPIFFRKR